MSPGSRSGSRADNRKTPCNYGRGSGRRGCHFGFVPTSKALDSRESWQRPCKRSQAKNVVSHFSTVVEQVRGASKNVIALLNQNVGARGCASLVGFVPQSRPAHNQDRTGIVHLGSPQRLHRRRLAISEGHERTFRTDRATPSNVP